MTDIVNSRPILTMIIGDLVTFLFSLILTLTIRYGEIPTRHLLAIHIPSFLILFVLFILINFSAGLYDKQAVLIRGRINGLLLKSQLMNVFVGIIFFYLAPVSISPKANLFIYFIISTLLLFIWRIAMYPVVSISRRQDAIIVGDGQDVQDIVDEVNNNTGYGLVFREHIIPTDKVSNVVSDIADAVKENNASIIVANFYDPRVEAAMPFLYSLIFSGAKIIDANKMYEGIFDRIPMSMVGDRWLIENSSTALGNRYVYDTLKRVMDVVIASVVGIVSLIIYPFVYLAITLDDKGQLFIAQERIGKNGKPIKMLKFRSMTSNDSGVYENGKTKQEITKVGRFIRMTRIDELPQLWSVIKGDQSLIGPRPELPALVKVYEKEIPYYSVRHLIKPGLSGWAQIYHRAHPHHAVAVDDTRDKLSYDLYYIKHRSLALDIRIALQTIKSILSKQGI